MADGPHAPFPGQTEGLGLPIGSLTSQWVGNLYLDEMDHLVKEAWRFPGYVRYMDDVVVWADDKDSLWWVRDRMEKWLHAERGLQLKAGATRVAPCTEGLPFLGLSVFPGTLRLQRKRLLRTQRLVRRREEELAAGVLSRRAFAASVGASVGILRAIRHQGTGAEPRRRVGFRPDGGAEAPAHQRARTASTGAAAGTTTPGTAVRRIATGTTPATGTTTWACASRARSRTRQSHPPGPVSARGGTNMPGPAGAGSFAEAGRRSRRGGMRRQLPE